MQYQGASTPPFTHKAFLSTQDKGAGKGAPVSGSHGTGTWARAVVKGDSTSHPRLLQLSVELDIS